VSDDQSKTRDQIQFVEGNGSNVIAQSSTSDLNRDMNGLALMSPSTSLKTAESASVADVALNTSWNSSVVTSDFADLNDGAAVSMFYPGAVSGIVRLLH